MDRISARQAKTMHRARARLTEVPLTQARSSDCPDLLRKEVTKVRCRIILGSSSAHPGYMLQSLVDPEDLVKHLTANVR